MALLVVLTAACTNADIGSSPPQQRHVFLIVMENHSAEQALSGQFIASLAAKYGVANNYHAVAHPSLPNYLALTSGSTWGVEDNDYHALPAADIGSQMTAAKLRWRAYMEGMGSDCQTDTDQYVVKHDPFAFYGGRCAPAVVPLDGLDGDL